MTIDLLKWNVILNKYLRISNIYIKTNTMSKKIKITENQLKMIMERKHSYAEQTNEENFDEIEQLKDDDKEKIDVKEMDVVKESVEKLKTDFKRFL